MSDIRFIVHRYLTDGMVVLPVNTHEKATRLEDWSNQDLQITDANFDANSNIAQRLDRLADVDCDSPETRRFAPHLLPLTNRKHGRPSLIQAEGPSHYWYQPSGDIKPEKFKDIDKTSLIEVRAGHKHYTLIPPSVVMTKSEDPQPETLEWIDGMPTPAPIDADGLVQSVRWIACAAMFARHWPRGGRHDATLAFAGMMFKLGASPMEVEQMLRCVTAYCEPQDGREGWSEIPGTVRSTYDLYKADKPHAGSREFAKAVDRGEDIVKRIFFWFGKDKGSATSRITPPEGMHALTETGDAETFADMYRHIVRHDFRQGRWLVSDETSGIWVPDPVEKLTQMTVDMMRARQMQSINLKNPADKKRASVWTIGGESRSRLSNAQALARSVPPIADPGDNWDQHPFLLGVQNGVVDLQTGEFRKATPEDRVTLRVRVPYDADATCPLWFRTLSQIFPGSPAVQPPAGADLLASPLQPDVDRMATNHSTEQSGMIAFLQRALGYSITGDCREECCFFAWGEGSNGKGTIMNTLGWLMADYYDDLPMSTLERASDKGKIPNDIAKLVGKRFITCSEVNEFTLNESRLKALTGRDPITARFLHQEFFTFLPVGKIWIATNNKPRIIGQDDGIWRRIYLIPFTQQFLGRENKALKDQLRDELPGILNWMITGAGLWLANGLQPPDEVRAATAAYRHESNPITPFIETCCVVEPAAKMQASQGYAAYKAYCDDQDFEPWRRLSERAWGKAMRQMFNVLEKRQTFYLGVGLRGERRADGAKGEPEGLQY